MINDICAIIVSFNGKETIIQTIEALQNQVNKVLIIDNNSGKNTIEVLKRIKSEKIHIIYNRNNFGVAKALNQGIAYAKENNYNWILTLDQDSICDENLIIEFRKSIDLYSANDMYSKIKVFAPRIFYNKKKYITKKKHQLRLTSITSGNLINVGLFDFIGQYNEVLFIDSVDFDFCLRIANSGFKIIQNNDAVIYHSLGQIKKIWFITIHVHSSIRRYYIARNHIYILKNYFKSNSIFCLKKNIWFLMLVLQIIFLESDKILNIKYIVLGLKDGMQNNFSNDLMFL